MVDAIRIPLINCSNEIEKLRDPRIDLTSDKIRDIFNLGI